MTFKEHKSALDRVASFATLGKASLAGSPWHDVSSERMKMRSSRASTSSEEYLSRPETSMSLLDDEVRSKNSTLKRSQRLFTADSEHATQDRELARVSQYIEYLDQYSRELEERVSYDRKMKIEGMAPVDRSRLVFSVPSSEMQAMKRLEYEPTIDLTADEETDVSVFLDEFKRASKAPEQALKIQRWWKMMRMMHKYRRFRRACRTIRSRYYGSILKNWSLTAYVSKHVRLAQMHSNFSSWSALVRNSIVWNDESAMIFLSCSRAGGGFHRELFLRLNDKATYRRAGMDYNWGRGWRFGRPLPTREHVIVAQLLRRIFLWSTRWRLRRWIKYVMGCRNQKNQATKKLERLGEERRHYRFWLKFHMWRRWSVVKICERTLKNIPEFSETIHEWNEWYKMYCTKKRLHSEQIKSLGRRFLTRLSWQRFQRFQQIMKGKGYLLEQTDVFRSRNVQRACVLGWTEYAKFQRAKKHRTQLILRNLSKLCKYSSFQSRKRKTFEQKWRRFRMQKTLIALAQISSAMLVLKVGLLNRIRKSTPRVLWALFAWMTYEKEEVERKPGGITTFGVCDGHFALCDSFRLWRAYTLRRINLKNFTLTLPVDDSDDAVRTIFTSWKSLKSTVSKNDDEGLKVVGDLKSFQVDMLSMGPSLAKMILGKQREGRRMQEMREKMSSLTVQERIAQTIKRIEEELGLNQNHISSEIPKLRLFMTEEASNQDLIHSLRIRCLKRDYKLLLAGEIRDCLKSFGSEWNPEMTASTVPQEQILFPEFAHSLQYSTEIRKNLSTASSRKQSIHMLDAMSESTPLDIKPLSETSAASESSEFVGEAGLQREREASGLGQLDEFGVGASEREYSSQDVETHDADLMSQETHESPSAEMLSENLAEVTTIGEVEAEDEEIVTDGPMTNLEGFPNQETQAKIKEKIISSAVSNFPLERISPDDMPHDEYLTHDYETRKSDLEQRFREMQIQFPSNALHSISSEEMKKRDRMEQDSDKNHSKDQDIESNVKEKNRADYVFLKPPKPFHGIDISIDFNAKAPERRRHEPLDGIGDATAKKEGPQRRRNEVCRNYNSLLDKLLQDHLEQSQKEQGTHGGKVLDREKGREDIHGRGMEREELVQLTRPPSLMISVRSRSSSPNERQHQEIKDHKDEPKIFQRTTSPPSAAIPGHSNDQSDFVDKEGGTNPNRRQELSAELMSKTVESAEEVFDSVDRLIDSTFKEIIQENAWIIQEAAHIQEALRGSMDSLYWRSKVLSGRSERQRDQHIESSKRDEMAKIAQQQKIRQLQDFISFQDLNSQLQDEHKVTKSMNLQDFQKVDTRPPPTIKLKSMQIKQLKKQSEIPVVERDFLQLTSPVQSIWINLKPFSSSNADFAETAIVDTDIQVECDRKLTPLSAPRDSFKQERSQTTESARHSTRALKKLKNLPRPKTSLDMLPDITTNLLKSEPIEAFMQASNPRSKSVEPFSRPSANVPIYETFIQGATIPTGSSINRQAIDEFVDALRQEQQEQQDQFQIIKRPVINKSVGRRSSTSLDAQSPMKIRGDGLLSREGKLWKQRSFNALRTESEHSEGTEMLGSQQSEASAVRASLAHFVVGGKKMETRRAEMAQKQEIASVPGTELESEGTRTTVSSQGDEEARTEANETAPLSTARHDEDGPVYLSISEEPGSVRRYVTSEIPWTPWTSMSAAQILQELQSEGLVEQEVQGTTPEVMEANSGAPELPTELAPADQMPTADSSAPKPYSAIQSSRREKISSSGSQSKISSSGSQSKISSRGSQSKRRSESSKEQEVEQPRHSVQELQLVLGDGGKRVTGDGSRAPSRQRSESQKQFDSRQEKRWDLVSRVNLEEQIQKRQRRKESIKSMYLAGISTMKPSSSPQVLRAAQKQQVSKGREPPEQPHRSQFKGPYLSARRIDIHRAHTTAGSRLQRAVDSAGSMMPFSAAESGSVNELRILDSPSERPEVDERSSQMSMRSILVEPDHESNDEAQVVQSEEEASARDVKDSSYQRVTPQPSSESPARKETSRQETSVQLTPEDRAMLDRLSDFPVRSSNSNIARVENNQHDGHVTETSDSCLSDSSSPRSSKPVQEVHDDSAHMGILLEGQRDSDENDTDTRRMFEDDHGLDPNKASEEGEQGERSKKSVDESDVEGSTVSNKGAGHDGRPTSEDDEKDSAGSEVAIEGSVERDILAEKEEESEEKMKQEMEDTQGKVSDGQDLQQEALVERQEQERRVGEKRAEGLRETKKLRPVEMDLLQGYREKKLTARMMEKQSVSPWRESHLKRLERERNLKYDSDSGEEDGEADPRAGKSYRAMDSRTTESVVKFPLQTLKETNRRFVAKRLEYHRYEEEQADQLSHSSLFSTGTYDYYLRRLQQKKKSYSEKDPRGGTP